MPPNGTQVHYSLDTSSIIEPWRRHYPPDAFPSVWAHIEDAATNGIVVASEEVLAELEKKDDEVLEWAKSHPEMFVAIDDEIQRVVRDILRDHPRLVDTRKNRSSADPFVIALAVVQALTVVTYEPRTRNLARPRIPDVCDAIGVGCIPFVEFVREQGWKI